MRRFYLMEPAKKKLNNSSYKQLIGSNNQVYHIFIIWRYILHFRLFLLLFNSILFTGNISCWVFRYITIILFLVIIMIIVIKKWHLIHQQWIKCLTNENRVDIQHTKTECSLFYFMCSFSIDIVYELLLNFNGSMENFVIL